MDIKKWLEPPTDWSPAAQDGWKKARCVIISVIGMTLLLAGIAMVVLPGPAFIVIPMGLAVLGTEFAWARHWLNRIKEKVQQGKDIYAARKAKQGADSKGTTAPAAKR